MHYFKSCDHCTRNYNLAEGHNLIDIAALFISSCYNSSAWPRCRVCLSWWNCQHADCSLPTGNVSALMSSLSVYENMHMIVCISSGKSDWKASLCFGNYMKLLEIRKKSKEDDHHSFQQINIKKKKTLCTYYTDSFFPCIRLDIHRNSWPPNPYKSLRFYMGPFHIHWHLQNKYTQTWISHRGN